jgi:hypothetical protein
VGHGRTRALSFVCERAHQGWHLDKFRRPQLRNFTK